MKESLYEAFKVALSILAVFLVSVTVIVFYGTYPRSEALVEAPDALVEAPESDYEFGPEDHAGFMDYLEEDEVDSLDIVVERLIEVENPQRDNEAVGDQHLQNKAYGLLQIRQPYLDDVNRIAGTSYAIEDMKNPELAKWAAKIYLDYYGRAYQRKTGVEPTLEVYGRIHNGGPNGWRKASTNNYVEKMGIIPQSD